ncbi:Protein of unknown function [Lentzea waywayandensis]|uniref:DUF3558 domain-containing protein n=1 Tax=Lentzea waywayandensis TaxID=84724 RepID=A0A1I6EZH5_9PSEU|nr:DUF3558 domain-containing protein [Lentzea waywayandensis]SFR22997.1 Protein of unknown function [Lentzea waywayandensis]
MTALLTAVLAFGALAGCTSSQTGGSPTTASATGSEQTSSQPTSDGSDSGLSITKYVSAPCNILTASQLTTLGSVRAPAPGTGTLGPNCVWSGQDVIKNSRYTVHVTEGQNYENQVNEVKNNAVFTDKKIDGVRVISTDRLDGLVTCLVSLQISKTDSVTIQVNVASDEQATKKACPEGERVAQLIISNLKG